MFSLWLGALGRTFQSCGWRIVVSPIFPWDFSSCYDSAMSNLVILFIHFIATLARQVPGITSVSSRLGFRKCLALSSVD
jgi:hypothetical protein